MINTHIEKFKINKIFINTISNTALYIINIVVAFVMSPIIVKAIGNRDYGIWDVIAGIVGYLGILDLGLGPALVRYVAVADSKKDDLQLNYLVSSAFFCFLIIGGVALVVFIYLCQYPASLFGQEAHQVNSFNLVLLIVGVNLLFKFPGSALIGTIMGLQRHYLLNLLRAVLTIGQAVVVTFLLEKNPQRGLLILASVEGVNVVVQFVVLLLIFLVAENFPIPRLCNFKFGIIKDLWWFGIKNSILMLSSRIQKQSITLILGWVVGFQSVIFFSLPNRLVDYGWGFSLAMGFPLMPYFSALSQQDVLSNQNGWKKTSLLLQIVTLAMPVFLWFTGEPFLRLWMGPEYADKGSFVMKFLALGLLVEAISPNAGRLIIGANRHGKTAKIWLLISIIFIPAAILGAYYGGVNGIALISSIASSCGAFTMLYYACQQIGITISEHLKDTVLPLVPPLTVTAGFLWMVFYTWKPDSYLILISGSSAALLLYFLLVVFQLKTRKHWFLVRMESGIK